MQIKWKFMMRSGPILVACWITTCCFFVGCAGVGTDDRPTDPKGGLTEVIGCVQGVIVPPEIASRQRGLSDRFESFWLVTSKEIAETDQAIRDYLAVAGKNKSIDGYSQKQAPKIYTKLSSYRWQYVGVVTDGERRVFCNVLTPDLRKYRNWKTQFIDMIEGAPQCWRIHYIVDQRRCTNFDASFGY